MWPAEAGSASWAFSQDAPKSSLPGLQRCRYLVESLGILSNDMKKAVILTGGKQYLVSEGETLRVEKLGADKKVSFDALLLIDDKKVSVGTPLVDGTQVMAEVIQPEVQADKVTAIRYKAKKRVRKVRGHRQVQTEIKITKIG